MKAVKKLLSVFIVLSLILSVIPISVSAASVFAGGNGTADNPYQISTAAQLKKMGSYTIGNNYFILINDIVFDEADYEEGGEFYNDGYGWEPIENFVATLDGNGYGIYNLQVLDMKIGSSPRAVSMAGLFSIVSGTVKNLGVYDCVIYSYGTAGSYAGAIAGMNIGEISQCYSSGSVVALSDTMAYAGGIAGCNSKIISLCQNYSYVYSMCETIDCDAASGGITGCSDPDSINTYCFNYGYVDGKVAGGIAGESHGAYTALCNNEGDINYELEDFEGLCTGGIVGYSTDNSFILGCYNTGEITSYATVNYAYAGGIAGHNNNSIIGDCYNLGAVTSKATASGVASSFAGGIAGLNTCDSTNEAYEQSIVTVYNRGKVNATVKSSSTTKYIGGIAGSSNCLITSSYYLNNVTNGIGKNYADSNGTKKLTDTQMKSAASYEGFDLKDMWWLNSKSGYNYPQLTLLSQNPVAEIVITQDIPNKTFYNDTLPDLSGGKMTVTYANGKSETLDTGELSTINFDSTKLGEQTLVAVYGGVGVAIDIIVISKAPDSIRLSSLPTKLTYVQGQPLNISGAALSAVYGDSYEVELDINEAGFSYDTTAVGEVEVTVSHGGLTTSFTITVTERTVSDIEIYSPPNAVVYKKGSEFSLSGAVLKTVFSSEDDYFELVEITSEMVSECDMSLLGKQTIIVTFGDQTASFDIHIVEATPGDVNGDGITDTSDLAALKLYLAGVEGTAIVNDPGNADCNCDTVVDTGDLARLKLILASS